MQRKSEFHHTEVGSEVSAGGSDLVDEELPDLEREIGQLILRKVRQISRSTELFKHSTILRTGTAAVVLRQIDIWHTVVVGIGGLEFEHRPVVPVADP